MNILTIYVHYQTFIITNVYGSQLYVLILCTHFMNGIFLLCFLTHPLSLGPRSIVVYIIENRLKTINEN